MPLKARDSHNPRADPPSLEDHCQLINSSQVSRPRQAWTQQKAQKPNLISTAETKTVTDVAETGCCQRCIRTATTPCLRAWQTCTHTSRATSSTFNVYDAAPHSPGARYPISFTPRGAPSELESASGTGTGETLISVGGTSVRRGTAVDRAVREAVFCQRRWHLFVGSTSPCWHSYFDILVSS
jgi:hypothetical protein